MASNPMLVALTGGIGCGKTTVLNEFRSLGVPTFVADDVAGAYYSDPDFLTGIRGLFGNRVFLADGSVDSLERPEAGRRRHSSAVK